MLQGTSFLERLAIFIPKSFKIAKLNSLIVENNSLIYALLFLSILDFCTATLSFLERILIFIIHKKL